MEMAGYKRSLSKPSEKDKTTKVNIEWKDLCYRKRRKTTHKIYILNNSITRKEPPNNNLTRRTEDREDWKAMIADIYSRAGT